MSYNPNLPCGSCPQPAPQPSCQKPKCGSCKSNCNIPHLVVDTVAELTGICGAFVTVRDENAVYHIDSNGNPVAVSRNPIFLDNHVPSIGLYKSTVVYDFAANKQYVYNYAGDFREVAGGLI